MIRLFLLILCAVFSVACRSESQTSAHNQSQYLESKAFILRDGMRDIPLQLEIADDDTERSRGLMFRANLPAGTGMLFVWPQAELRTFWMKNTSIPLDLLFIQSGRVVGIIPWAKPFDESPLQVGISADMVLEVPGGWASEQRIGVGAILLPGQETSLTILPPR